MRWLPVPVLILVTLQPVRDQDTSCDGICGRRPLASSHHLLRIVGGSNALPGTWPWHVNFQTLTHNGPANACGGTLISPRWVLSASHCFTDKEQIPWIKVVVGNTKLSDPGPDAQQRRIKRVINHELYQNNLDQVDGGVPNDVSLIEMDEPVRCSDYVQPACLPDDRVDVSALTHCYVSGWGTMDVPTQKQPDIQQEVRVDLVPRRICGGPSSWHKRILDENLCAGRKEEGIGLCQGDSGGPLMCREERSERYWVVGISSWTTVICGNPQFPGVFTSTLYHLDWIRRKTKENLFAPSRPPLLALFATPTIPNTSPKPHINTQYLQNWNAEPPRPPPMLRPTDRPRPPILYLTRPVPTPVPTGWPQRPGTKPPPRWSTTMASWLRPTTRWASTYRPWRTSYAPWGGATTWQSSKRPLTWFGLTYRTRATQRLTPSAPPGYYSSYNWNRDPPNPRPPKEKQ